MSSHHFVKEGQEPALLVVDAMADDHLLALLEWSPTVLVLKSALDKVLSWGIRVDVIVHGQVAHSDLVTETAPGIPWDAEGITIGRSLPETVFSFLRARAQHAVNVIIGSPEKHLNSWENPDFQVVLFDKAMKWSLVTKGSFEKWLPAGVCFWARGNADLNFSGSAVDDVTLIRRPLGETGVVVTAERAGIVSLSSALPFWVGELYR